MKGLLLALALPLLLSGCGLNLQHKADSEPPKAGYKTVHHTVTFDTHQQCVASCDPSVKNW